MKTVSKRDFHPGLLLSYLPAFFVAGALCLIAALFVLMINGEKKTVAAPATA